MELFVELMLHVSESSSPRKAGRWRPEHWRGMAGALLAPAAFAAIWFHPPANVSPEAGRLAAVMAAVVVLWISEVVPMPVTALLGAALCVLLGVAPAKTVFAPFADKIMFLFIGSFMLAKAIFLYGVDRRLAYAVMSWRWIDARPARLLFVHGAVAAMVSGWISNTATTVMMLAIGMSLVEVLLAQPADSGGTAPNRRYATGVALMTTFAASIGGLLTPIGTPTNLIGLGFLEQAAGQEISFLKWMMISTPAVLLLYLVLFTYLNWFCPADVRQIPGGTALLARRRAELGTWSVGERSTLAAFLLTAGLWIAPGVIALAWGEECAAYQFFSDRLPEGVVALLGAGLLFVLPGDRRGRALDWQAAAEIDWGVVLLYGGGFALGSLAESTGLAGALGRAMAGWVEGRGEWSMLFAATAVAALVSEFTSNTASAAIVVPLVIATARQAGFEPLLPALGATMGASLGFMMPVSTPCNAIAYSSGHIPLGKMIRYGALLDVVGVAVIVLVIGTLGRVVW